MRSRMARKRHRGTATSAIWEITHRECVTTLAPILMSFSGSPDVRRNQRPVLHRPRQRQPTQEVAQVARQGEQVQTELAVHEVAATQPRPLDGILAFASLPLRRTAIVVERDHPPGRTAEVRHDEADAREQIALVVLDLRHHPTKLVPRARLVEDFVMPDDRLVGRTAPRPVLPHSGGRGPSTEVADIC
jgi:hypothetical protein